MTRGRRHGGGSRFFPAGAGLALAAPISGSHARDFGGWCRGAGRARRRRGRRGRDRRGLGARIAGGRTRALPLRSRQSLLELRDLRHAPRVRLHAGEPRVGPGPGDLGRRVRIEGVHGQAEDIGVVLLATLPGGGHVGAEGCPHAPELVRGDGGAHAAGAHEHARLGEAAEHGLAHHPRVIRIVHGVRREAAEVQDHMPARFEGQDERRLHREADVVAADRDAHGGRAWTPSILSGEAGSNNVSLPSWCPRPAP